MPESTRIFSEISRNQLDTMVANFIETVGNLFAIEHVSLKEQALAVEHIGKRLREEFCEVGLLGHAMLAKQILTIATLPVLSPTP